MKKIKKQVVLILPAVIILNMFSCSTKKKTFIHRKYHNITAKYNGYFNGKESLKQGIKKIEKSYEDDYTRTLNIYKTNHLKSEKSHHIYMDKAIRKGSMVIQKHSIKIRGKQYCKWIDDSYLMVGKAYFYKGEFKEALNTFQFIKKEFKKNPISYKASLWAARSLVEIGDFHGAELELEDIEGDRRFPEEETQEYHKILADIYLRQERIKEAQQELKITCNHIKLNRKKVRYHYVLAQTYQEEGNVKEAKKYYELVLRTNPEYEMVFNAKINLARSLRETKDLKEMRIKLIKMIKDEKNKEYLDQIYYTLAEIDVFSGDSASAIQHYKTSTQRSVNNDPQKGESHLCLAKIFYKKTDYFLSKKHYDSAYAFVKTHHPEYKEIEIQKQKLEKLVYHLNIIHHQDSLQKLALMKPQERLLIIQTIIAEIIKKEEEERTAMHTKNQGIHEARYNTEGFGNNVSAGKWYFYNPATLSFGMSEFRKQWGTRKLEDDWRRSNKKSLKEIENDSTALVKKEKNQETKNQKSEQYYLEKIPLTSEKMKESNNKIINSYYELSVIYKEDFGKEEKSDNVLTTLIDRFPNNIEHTPKAYYTRYQTHKKNKAKASRIKNDLINNFPTSIYSKILADSNYLIEEMVEEEKEEKTYQLVYQKYFKKNYEEAEKEASFFYKKYTEEGNPNQYIIKYYLIKILSSFKLTQDTSLFRKNLKKGIEKTKEKKEKEQFQELLNLIENPEIIQKKNKQAIAKSPYLYNKTTKHYNIIITEKEGTDITYIKTLLSDYHLQYYSTEILDINALLLGLDKHILIIKFFENKNNAMKYFNNLNTSTKVINELNKTNYKRMVISEENFKEFYKNKDIKGYFKFFQKNYLD